MGLELCDYWAKIIRDLVTNDLILSSRLSQKRVTELKDMARIDDKFHKRDDPTFRLGEGPAVKKSRTRAT